MPDSVLLCTKGSTEEKQDVMSVYSNIKMNNLFGKDLVKRGFKKSNIKGLNHAESKAGAEL